MNPPVDEDAALTGIIVLIQKGKPNAVWTSLGGLLARTVDNSGLMMGRIAQRMARGPMWFVFNRYEPSFFDLVSQVTLGAVDILGNLEAVVGERDEGIPANAEIHRKPTINLDVVLYIKSPKAAPEIDVKRRDLVEGRGAAV